MTRERRYLVDTNVVSRRSDLDLHMAVVEWFARYGDQVHVSVVTAAEMRRGLLLLRGRLERRADPRVAAREAQRLDQKQAWYDEVVGRFHRRFEPIDLEIAEKWAEISVRFPSLRDADKVIGATALVRDFDIATENLADFRALGLGLVNPFDRDTWPQGPEPDPIETLIRR